MYPARSGREREKNVGPDVRKVRVVRTEVTVLVSGFHECRHFRHRPGTTFASTMVPSSGRESIMDRVATTELTAEQYDILFDPFLTWHEIEAGLRKLNHPNRDDPPEASTSRPYRGAETRTTPVSTVLRPVASAC